MKYHDSIINLLYYILKQGEEYLNHIDSGNAYDKILRNYHQFNYKGERVYRNLSRMEKHYRFSENAWKNRSDKKSLYFEHLKPLKLVKEELIDLIKHDKITIDNIKTILNRTEIVVITKTESRVIDEVHKSSLPENGVDRLTAINITIEEKSKENDLFRDPNLN